MIYKLTKNITNKKMYKTHKNNITRPGSAAEKKIKFGKMFTHATF